LNKQYQFSTRFLNSTFCNRRRYGFFSLL